MVDTNYERARTILTERMEILHNMAEALMQWETIDKHQIDELMKGKKIAPPTPEPEKVTEDTETGTPGNNVGQGGLAT